MSHAPGAGPLPSREELAADQSFAGLILGTFKERIEGAKEKAKGKAPAKSETGATARSASGIHAFERTLQASVRQNQRRKRKEKPPVDQTLIGASKHIDGSAPAGGVVTGGGPPDPSFASLLPGALTLPFRGAPLAIVHAVIVTLALLLLELSPPLGLVACALAVLELFSLRTKLVRDACAGRDRVAWPEVSELAGSAAIAGAASLLLAPALVVALLGWGEGAVDPDSTGSLVARAKRIAKPVADPKLQRSFGQNTLLSLEALVASELPEPGRKPVQIAESVQRSFLERAEQLALLEGAGGLGLAARALFLLGFLLFPMAVLAATRLRSVYAALYMPIVVRSCLLTPGTYLLILLSWALYWGSVAAIVFLLPGVLRAQLGAGAGHLAWAGLVGLQVAGGAMVLASLLGRLYRSRQLVLGWD